LGEWLQGIHRDLNPLEIRLGPLTLVDTLHLVEGFGDSTKRARTSENGNPRLEKFRRWIFSHSAGQPFFAVEMIRELLGRGVVHLRVADAGQWEIEPPSETVHQPSIGVLPASVREVIRARPEHLARPARELLGAAAVLGQHFTFEQMTRIAGLGENEALHAMDGILAVNLLRQALGEGSVGIPPTYSFAHDRIRAVVYAESGVDRQGVFHRRALDVLQLQAIAPAAELARHALAAGLEEPAIRFSVQAGDDAMRLLAARDALLHYGRALSIAQTSSRTAEVAELHARCL
jgi:predicted ATPase